MRIGQILVEQRWVDPAALARALADQPGTGQRICSLLILRGQLDPDHAARALATQHNVPGVLQRHLERRDPALTALLPAATARTHTALPIGRTGAGALIVCVRDPGPERVAAIAAAVTGPVVIAVAPAHQLEQLVGAAYPAVPGDPPPASDGDAIDVDLSTRQIPVIGDPLDHLGSMTLVELDDVRVARDPSQSGQHEALQLPRTTTGVYIPPRTVTTSYPPFPPGASHPPPQAPGPHPPPRTVTHPRPGAPGRSRGSALDTATAAIERAATPVAAGDAAMQYLAGRFHHALWFAIREGAALGERGHGGPLTAEVVQAIAVPLTAPSIIQRAHDTGRLVTQPPPGAGAIQDRLARALGNPAACAAMPVEVDARVAIVIAVGDPVDAPATATTDLELLGHALAAAYRRMTGR